MKGRHAPESIVAPGGVPLPSGPRFYPVPRLSPAQKARAKAARALRLRLRRLGTLAIATGQVPVRDEREHAWAVRYVAQLRANGVVI